MTDRTTDGGGRRSEGSDPDAIAGSGSGADGDGEAGPTEAAARRLLEAIRAGDDPDSYLATLADADGPALAPVRTDRARALAFWLNLYNAGTQLLLARRPALYERRLRVVRFFRAPCVTVAGRDLSLDTIEHGILRGSRSKYGLGYLPRLLPRVRPGPGPGDFERRYRLAAPDPRIHFALNCGAESCPAIRSYAPGTVDEQLDAATRAYLEATVDYDAAAGRARLPRVFLWYRGDFGGGAGIRALLREHGAIPDGADPRLRYRQWNWSRAPRKFEAEGEA